MAFGNRGYYAKFARLYLDEMLYYRFHYIYCIRQSFITSS